MTNDEALMYHRRSYQGFIDTMWDGDEENNPFDKAFIKALTALENQERYKWHDLRKNPDVLPIVNPVNNHDNDVLLLVQDKNRPEDGADWHIGNLKSAEHFSICDESGKTNFWGMPSYDCNWCIWGWSYFHEPEVLAWKEIEPFVKED